VPSLVLCRFGFIVRTDRQTDRQNHRGASTLYSRDVSNADDKDIVRSDLIEAYLSMTRRRPYIPVDVT